MLYNMEFVSIAFGEKYIEHTFRL